MKKDSESWQSADDRTIPGNQTWAVFEDLDQCSFYNFRIREVGLDGAEGKLKELTYQTSGCFQPSPLQQLLSPAHHTGEFLN